MIWFAHAIRSPCSFEPCKSQHSLKKKRNKNVHNTEYPCCFCFKYAEPHAFLPPPNPHIFSVKFPPPFPRPLHLVSLWCRGFHIYGFLVLFAAWVELRTKFAFWFTLWASYPQSRYGRVPLPDPAGPHPWQQILMYLCRELHEYQASSICPTVYLSVQPSIRLSNNPPVRSCTYENFTCIIFMMTTVTWWQNGKFWKKNHNRTHLPP